MIEVRGYKTSQGLFFEEKEDAMFAEATYILEKAVSASLYAKEVETNLFLKTIQMFPDEVIQYAKAFINVKNLQPSSPEKETT